MASGKETLIRYIESYASARVSGNPDLQAFAANQLTDFIDSIPFPPEETAVPGEAGAETTH